MLRRQALGQINNHTNNSQQLKPAKTTAATAAALAKPQVPNDKENDIIRVAPKARKPSDDLDSFDIFCDDKHDQVDNVLHQQNPTKRPPLVLQCQQQQQQKIDSPMILDTSCSNGSLVHMSSLDNSADVSAAGEWDLSTTMKKDGLDQHLGNCEEYAVEILDYLRAAEQRQRPKPQYIHQQQDITPSMRSILVDWLVEVCEEYKLHTETLYLAVNYTDRFLSKMSVLRGKLQLLGTASMYIASKYEEIYPPDVNEFVYITDDTYSKQQVLRMEHLVLKVLNFQMTTPTANCFLLHFLRVLKMDKKIEHLSRYLAELTLIDGEPFLEYLPSQIAASAVYLALQTTGQIWTTEISEQVGYKLNELRLCIRDMHKTWTKAADHPQQAIQDKYKQEKYDFVSTIHAPAEF